MPRSSRPAALVLGHDCLNANGQPVGLRHLGGREEDAFMSPPCKPPNDKANDGEESNKLQRGSNTHYLTLTALEHSDAARGRVLTRGIREQFLSQRKISPQRAQNAEPRRTTLPWID
jgi:hypothetical protein